MIIQNKLLKDVSKFMKEVDLNIDKIGIEEKFEFRTDKDIPVPEFKEMIIKALKHGDIEVLKIEGGKIE